METYSLLREFADSWFLLGMFSFFMGVVLWAFRPGSRPVHEDAGQIPLRNDAARAQDTEPQEMTKEGQEDV